MRVRFSAIQALFILVLVGLYAPSARAQVPTCYDCFRNGGVWECIATQFGDPGFQHCDVTQDCVVSGACAPQFASAESVTGEGSVRGNPARTSVVSIKRVSAGRTGEQLRSLSLECGGTVAARVYSASFAARLRWDSHHLVL
jgi:hypothetical protein